MSPFGRPADHDGLRSRNVPGALVRADYHGAFLRVVQSKCPLWVGKAGIVVQESMNMFMVVEPSKSHITRKALGRLLLSLGGLLIDRPSLGIPKAGTVFSCQVEGLLTWHLFGDQLRQTSGLRSSKKFKSKNSVAL